MKTFDQKTKDKWIAIMTDHRETDRLIRGKWIEDQSEDSGLFKGCFFGCAMQTSEDPLKMAIKEMNLPPWLVYLAEKIYEGLPEGDFLDWPVNLLQAIPVNKDISLVKHKLAIWRLTELADKNKSVSVAINKVIKCHRQALNGDDQIDWLAARLAARLAASATEPYSTWVAVKSAEKSAENLAWSAAESAARSAESEAWLAESEKLIELLKAV